MVKSAAGALFLLFLFGIPFLAMQDLFPLHRYGMFARSARLPGSLLKHYSIEIRHPGRNWEELQTGSPYFDSGFFPEWARRAVEKPEIRTAFTRKIKLSFPITPDSVRIRIRDGSGRDRLVVLP
jgi:hypothetical protein